MKNITIVIMILVTVLPVAMAQTQIEADKYVAEIREAYTEAFADAESAKPECPAPTSAKKAAAKLAIVPAVTKVPQVVNARPTLPFVGWPDTLVWVLAGAVLLLALVVAFLLGRVTGVQHAPQVVTPVVYVQPPDPPRIVRP